MLRANLIAATAVSASMLFILNKKINDAVRDFKDTLSKGQQDIKQIFDEVDKQFKTADCDKGANRFK
jgi:hypothetical protein